MVHDVVFRPGEGASSALSRRAACGRYEHASVHHPSSPILSATAPSAEVTRILNDPRYASPKRISRCGWRASSQTDEDGLIQEIFRRIGTTGRRFLEIGVGDGLENNTAYLLACGWSGTWIESDAERSAAILRNCESAIREGRLAVLGVPATPAGVDELILDSGLNGEIDLLSLDIDGNDYHVLRSITAVRPRVVVVEYNASYHPPVRWIMPYDPAHRWDGSNHFGASLEAYADLLGALGYALVGCGIAGINAFFVRADLAAERFAAPFDAANHFEPPRYYLAAHFAQLSGHPPRRG